MEAGLGAFLTSIGTAFSTGNFLLGSILAFIFIVVLLIFKPDILDKILSRIQFNKKKNILSSESYQNFVQSAILRSISKTRTLKDEYSRKIRTSKDSILRNQMNLVENSIEIIVGEQLDVYRKTLKTKIKDLHFCLAKNSCGHCGETVSDRMCSFGEDIENINVDLYEKILHDTYTLFLAEARRAFKENGYDVMTDSEFELYLEKIAHSILVKLDRFIRDKILEHTMVLTYDDGFGVIDKRILAEQIKSVFIQARKISIKTYSEIKDLEAELSEKIKAVAIEEELNLLMREKIEKEL